MDCYEPRAALNLNQTFSLLFPVVTFSKASSCDRPTYRVSLGCFLLVNAGPCDESSTLVLRARLEHMLKFTHSLDARRVGCDDHVEDRLSSSPSADPLGCGRAESKSWHRGKSRSRAVPHSGDVSIVNRQDMLMGRVGLPE